MRRSIATVSLSGDIEAKLTAISKAGFQAAEIFENDLLVSPHSPSDIALIAADLGLALEMYQPFRDFDGVSDELFTENLRRANAKFSLMEQLGTELLLVCTNVATATIDDDELLASQLRQLAAAAANHGVRVAYEALAWGKFVSDIDHTRRIVNLVDHPALGHCLDSFHILSRNWPTSSIDKIPAEKIFFCQIADAPWLELDVLSWSRHHRVFPGEGAWDLPDFMSHLASTGYDGTVSLEIFNDVFRQTPVSRTASDAMRSLLWLEDQTAIRMADQPSQMHFGRLPKMEQPTGFSFAEVKSLHEPQLDAVLSQLGFEHRGSHRTKDVELWASGSARVIVNSQADAGRPRLSAIGLDVPDPETTAKRAMDLRSAPVDRFTAPGDKLLRGVTAPDEREIFLCPPHVHGVPSWMDEFSPVGVGAPDSGRGILRVDHVNLLQPWQFFDEAVLFYESALALSSQPALEVAAPYGLVRSKVMGSSDDSVRLALNVAPLLSDSTGAAEHVAFVCGDIVHTARDAKTRGLRMLAIPTNYYDDLAARFPLSDTELETLQELNLLYDQDSTGEYRQFYTPVVGRVFFEVVERRGAYRSFGPGNAPVRLAAQFDHVRRASNAR